MKLNRKIQFNKQLKGAFVCSCLFGLLTPSVEAAGLMPNTTPMRSNHTPTVSLNHPIQIAQVLGCPRAEEVETFETANFYAYICRGQDGTLFYRGLSKGDGSQINVMNVTTGDDGTYYAVNGNVVYSVNPNRLQVTENDRVILTEEVMR